MTAYTGRLVAISLHEGRYAVSSQAYADLDYKALELDGNIHDVSENSSYIDEVAILQKNDVPKYFLQPSKWSENKGAQEWFASLGEDVFLVLYHVAQFESGFGD